ncbi:response regulator transcription factor, partial [bacterium]|nr:response regulator transcription factor [bacterium]
CMDRIKVLIVDDHRVVRDGLSKILESCNDIHVIGEAANGLEAIRKYSELKPDVILLDISMPKLGGLEVSRRIKKENPSAKIVILSMHEEEEYSMKLVRLGVSGYLLKDSAAQEVIEAVRTAFAGRAYFSPQISKTLAESYREVAPIEDDPYERLNDREREVLQLIAEGHTNKAIADILFISPKTVDNHRTNLMRKLNIHSAADLVRWATKRGLVG